MAIFKRSKILATIGPATNSYQMIENLIRNGANGLRLNFSHGQYEERDQQIEWVRRASKKLGKPVAILQDLQGPKIRLGMIKGNSFKVRTGDELVLDHAVSEHDGSFRLPVQYNLANKVKPGEAMYIFDGKIRAEVVSIKNDNAICIEIKNDGVLMSKKGINLPDTDFSGDIFTKKDFKDIDYGVSQDFDYVSLSFVQSADDIKQLRRILVEKDRSDAQIIAKIETRTAIEPNTLEEIVKASDGIMVARGDLAVEVGAELVPIVQRRTISLCRKYSKISIVATQMMASMVDSPEPTRAEVSDVATAVIQGVDVVMLSDETAAGKYPGETVAAMKKVINYTQEHADVAPGEVHITSSLRDDDQHAIAEAAVNLAEHLNANAIVAETKSGATALRIASYRPNLPIISVTSSRRAAQQLALTYANKSYVRPDSETAGVDIAKELKAQGYFDDDTVRVVLVSGQQPGKIGGTDTLRFRTI